MKLCIIIFKDCGAMRRFESSSELAVINLQNIPFSCGFCKEALSFWKKALKCGNDCHHHRANIYSWMSRMYELQEEYFLARFMAQKAYDLWKKAVGNDPNPAFQKKLKDAEKVLIEITAKNCSG